MLESGLKQSDFITTENYYIRLGNETAKKLTEKIQVNLNKRYEFGNKQHTLEKIVVENIREFSKFILGKTKSPDFKIPGLSTSRYDNSAIKE